MEIDVLQHIKDLGKLKCALFTSCTVRKNKLTAIYTEGVGKSWREAAERGKLVLQKKWKTQTDKENDIVTIKRHDNYSSSQIKTREKVIKGDKFNQEKAVL